MGVATSTLADQVLTHPFHIVLELAFAASLAYLLLFSKKSKRLKAKADAVKLPPADVQERRIAEFESELFNATSPPGANTGVPSALGTLEVESRSGYHVTVKGGTYFKDQAALCTDLATYDFHSFSTNQTVVSVARAAVNAYGVGSCGPRGFYGTVKPHLDLEEDLAKFLNVDDVIIYSFSFATISTLISCYASRGDYLVVDDSVSLSVQEGVSLSRANATYYRHNDMADLEKLMKEVVDKETRQKKLSRRFVVTEGLFRNTGDLCDLPRIAELCEKHKFRIILDDSFGFGVLGASGRGTPEFFDVGLDKIEIYVASLSTSLGAVGGFCAGKQHMIDHQRLSAAAYVFSASLPPYMTSAASASLGLLTEDKSYVANILAVSKAFREAMVESGINDTKLNLVPCAENASPVVILRPSKAFALATKTEEIDDALERIVGRMQQQQHILIMRNLFNFEEKIKATPSLRIVLKSKIPVEDAKKYAKAVVAAVKAELH